MRQRDSPFVSCEHEENIVNKLLFIEYPKCSTCKRAKKWLDEHGVAYADRHIVEENPTAAELAEWQARSGLPVRRFFNTSGQLYRQMGVKAQLDAGMSDADAFDLLATNGMLVKRPLVVGEDFVLVGFKEAEWSERLLSVGLIYRAPGFRYRANKSHHPCRRIFSSGRPLASSSTSLSSTRTRCMVGSSTAATSMPQT